MDVCDILWYGVIVIVLVQILRLALADADLKLLFKHHFGLQPNSLAGKNVWITGASSGIGENLAYDLVKAGCHLVLSARRVSELERVKKNCLCYGKTKEENILIQELDILDFDTHTNIVAKVLSHVPKIDILVNNAGRSQRALIKDTSLEVDRQLLEINTLGTMSLSKALLPHFIMNKCGHFVVTSSIAGKLGAPISAAYSASKHALQGWFEALRIEFAEYNIDVTLVCPGPVYSNISVEAFTGVAGKKAEEVMKTGENRMKTERCTELMTIAIANKLGEVWISNQPILLFTYIFQYLPDLARWIGRHRGMNIRVAHEQKKNN